MIRFCILDHDARYAEALINFLSVRYGDQVEPSLFHSLESLKDFLRGHRVDLILASGELLPEPELLPSQTVAYLTEDQELERLNGCPVIFRYQRGETILRQIKGAAAESDTRNAVYSRENQGKSWLFMGAGGGMGTTTAAIGCAAQLALSGRKVLYLCLQSNGCISEYLHGEGTGGMARVLYEVKTFLGSRDGQGKLAPKLESLLKYDADLGIYYYDPYTFPMESISMTAEEVGCLLQTLEGSFEEIIVDVDAAFTPILKELLNCVDQILLLSNGTDTANRRLVQLIDAFSMLEESEDSRILFRTRILYNCFGSSAVQADDRRVLLAGTIQKYAGADGRRIVEEIRKKNTFLTLSERKERV